MEHVAHNPLLDSQVWPNIIRRNDDVVIATYAKFGHLRMQIIIHEMLNASKGEQQKFLPWVELRYQNIKDRIEVINAFRGRRILRTHFPSEQVYVPSGKFLFIGRDPRDLVFNLFNFLKGVNQDWYEYFDPSGKKLQRPAQYFESFWGEWMERDGAPFWSYFKHLQSWWEQRNKDNVLLIQFLDFKENMEKELHRISEFLNLPIQKKKWPVLLEACDFDRISKLCSEEIDMNDLFWHGGSSSNAGGFTASKWKDFLTNKHDVELRNKVRGIVGKSGKDWLLRI